MCFIIRMKFCSSYETKHALVIFVSQSDLEARAIFMTTTMGEGDHSTETRMREIWEFTQRWGNKQSLRAMHGYIIEEWQLSFFLLRILLLVSKG